MTVVKTPCIGICSTTSFGDKVCRGCKRYAFEVIEWNAYSSDAKNAVLRRVEQLNTQILQHRLRIFSLSKLEDALKRWRIPYDSNLSAYCWLHNLLKKAHGQLSSFEEVGVAAMPGYTQMSLAELCEQIEEELLVLSEAHFERYVDASQRDAG